MQIMIEKIQHKVFFDVPFLIITLNIGITTFMSLKVYKSSEKMLRKLSGDVWARSFKSQNA